MNTRLLISFLCLVFSIPLSAGALKKEKSQNEPSAERNSGKETQMLEYFLKMDPEELSNIRQTIERIERMSAEEKKALSDRIGKLDRLKPERVNAMRARFKSIPKEKREAMRQRWIDMNQQERRKWRKKLKPMTHEERADLFETEGFLPTFSKPAGKNEDPKRKSKCQTKNSDS